MATYEELLQEPVSEKIVLVEFDNLTELDGDTLWIPHNPGGIWKTTYSWDVETRTYVYGDGAWGYGAYGSTDTYDLPQPATPPILKIKSLVIDAIDWTPKDNYEDMFDEDMSYWWDSATQTLYINTPGDNPNSYTSILLGVTQGFSSKADYYDGLYYDGLVTSVPKQNRNRDVGYYGLISPPGGSLSLLNEDGNFDRVSNRGQAIRIFFGFPEIDYSEYEQTYSGYIETIKLSGDSFTIGLRDNRKLLEKSLPVKTISDDYAYASIEESGLYQQITYGVIQKGKAVLVNNYKTFSISDTTYHNIKSIDEVFVGGESMTFTTNLTEGTFTITDINYDEEKKDDVYVDFQGYVDEFDVLIEEPLDIIKDILSNYTQLAYPEDYNTVSWEYYSNLLTQKQSLFIGENYTDIVSVIGEICLGVQGLFDIEGTGNVTFLKQDRSKDSVKDITIDMLQSPGTVAYDEESYASTVRVGYNRVYEDDTYTYYSDKSQEESRNLEYRRSITREMVTLLRDGVDAKELAEEFLDYYGGFLPVFTFTTTTQNLDIKIEDNVNLQTYFYETGDYASIKLEIIGISTNFNNFTTTFKGRYIETVSGELDLTALIRWRKQKAYSTGSIVGSSGKLWRAIEPSVGEIPTISSDFWDELLFVAGDTDVGPLKYNGTTKLAGALYGGAESPTSTNVLNYDGYFYATRVNNAVYNDLAEYFYSEGEKLDNRIYSICEDGKVKLSTKEMDEDVVGISSTTAGFILRDSIKKEGVLLGLAGTVELDYIGSLKPGDMVISSGDMGKGRKATKEELNLNRFSLVGKVIQLKDERALVLIMR